MHLKRWVRRNRRTGILPCPKFRIRRQLVLGGWFVLQMSFVVTRSHQLIPTLKLQKGRKLLPSCCRRHRRWRRVWSGSWCRLVLCLCTVRMRVTRPSLLGLLLLCWRLLVLRLGRLPRLPSRRTFDQAGRAWLCQERDWLCWEVRRLLWLGETVRRSWLRCSQ